MADVVVERRRIPDMLTWAEPLTCSMGFDSVRAWEKVANGGSIGPLDRSGGEQPSIPVTDRTDFVPGRGQVDTVFRRAGQRLHTRRAIVLHNVS